MPSELVRVLYVEDDPDIREVALMALETIGGFTVEPCESGMQALDKAETFAPQLILMDVMMPKMDGPATVEALRKRPSLVRVPVVFMTAKVQPNEVAEFLSLGAADVVAKPFDPMTLSGLLRDIWARGKY